MRPPGDPPPVMPRPAALPLLPLLLVSSARLLLTVPSSRRLLPVPPLRPFAPTEGRPRRFRASGTPTGDPSHTAPATRRRSRRPRLRCRPARHPVRSRQRSRPTSHPPPRRPRASSRRRPCAARRRALGPHRPWGQRRCRRLCRPRGPRRRRQGLCRHRGLRRRVELGQRAEAARRAMLSAHLWPGRPTASRRPTTTHCRWPTARCPPGAAPGRERAPPTHRTDSRCSTRCPPTARRVRLRMPWGRIRPDRSRQRRPPRRARQSAGRRYPRRARAGSARRAVPGTGGIPAVALVALVVPVPWRLRPGWNGLRGRPRRPREAGRSPRRQQGTSPWPPGHSRLQGTAVGRRRWPRCGGALAGPPNPGRLRADVPGRERPSRRLVSPPGASDR